MSDTLTDVLTALINLKPPGQEAKAQPQAQQTQQPPHIQPPQGMRVIDLSKLSELVGKR